MLGATEKREPVDIARGAGLLVKHFLENILQLVEIEEAGEPVPIDEVVLAPPETAGGTTQAAPSRGQPRSWPPYDKLAAYKLQEPRLAMIGTLLERILGFTSLRFGGRTVAADGFRLKNLERWARYPFSRLFENFGEISSRCSCTCEFCFLRGTVTPYTKMAMLSVSEASTRARYYSAEKQTGLPAAAGWPGEPFLNPRILNILEIARTKQPGVLLNVTTNGDFLTPAVIDRLARLKPICLVVSLNSANPDVRRRIMGSRRPETAVEAIPLLREKGLQFVGSIVTPGNHPVEDIAETARYLDRHEALQIRLMLPGFTRFHPAKVRFDTEPCWSSLVALARELRQEITTPIMIQPSYFWNQDISAHIDGVYRNSPAERAGLRFGDRILHIDGHVIITKSEAADLLRLIPGEETGRGSFRRRLKIDRQGRMLEVELIDASAVEDDLYPYKPRGHRLCDESFKGNGLGIHLIDGFRLEDLKSMVDCIRKHPHARKVLLFTTPLVKHLLAQAVQIVGNSPAFRVDGIELRTTMAEHTFWGGNIRIGDLHVVQDYIERIRFLEARGYRPDLVLIPRSFVGDWGFDVTGQSWAEIERRTGVPVDLLTNVRVMM
jgi:wyosine [tRNA(Phe)-imidazoG37] synthetase (radical SAM superfamily)